MSCPHNSGSAALIRAVHSDWTVPEVKSAMMMTSFNGGTKEDGTTPWDADDVGTGRIDLTKAALAGLVMDETTQHFLDANPNTGGDPKTLNIPSVRNMECTPTAPGRAPCATRSLRYELDGDRHCDYAGIHDRRSAVELQLYWRLGETQELTITATPETNLTSAVAFGEVVLAVDANGPNGIAIPNERITVAIEGTNGGGDPNADTNTWRKLSSDNHPVHEPERLQQVIRWHATITRPVLS